MTEKLRHIPGAPLNNKFNTSSDPFYKLNFTEDDLSAAVKITDEAMEYLAKEVAPKYEEWLSKNSQTEDKPKYDKLTSLTTSYFQEGDSMIDGDQQLELSTEDGGGGIYFVLKTERWAFDSLEELSDLIQDFINTQKTIENGNH